MDCSISSNLSMCRLTGPLSADGSGQYIQYSVQNCQDMITCRGDGVLSESPSRELLQQLRSCCNQSIMVPRLVPSWGRCSPCRGISQLPTYIGRKRTRAPQRCFSMNPGLRQQTAPSSPYNTPQYIKKNTSTL